MLELQNYFVKEHVGWGKMHDAYDILNPETQEKVGTATENISGFKKFLRLFLSKKLMSTQAEIHDFPGNNLLFRIFKPVGFFRETVEVYDASNQKIGYFKSKMFSLGGGFYVYDPSDKIFAEVKGKWTGWDFKFLTPEGVELGSVSKKWAGLAKELFTTADNYVISVSPDLADQPVAKMLLIAATLAIDMVYYEQGG